MDGRDGDTGVVGRSGGGWWPPARWGAVSALLGLLLWYPATGWPGSHFWGLDGDLPPTQLVYGYLLLLGSGAAATAASLVVADWWARIGVLVVTTFAVARLVIPEGSLLDVPHERFLLVALLVAGQGAGFVVGSVLRRWTIGWGVGLGVVAALQQTDTLAVWFAGAGLVVCALVVRRGSVASVVRAVAGLVLTSLVVVGLRLAAFALVYGWGDVRRGSGFPSSPAQALERVLAPMRDFLRTESWTYLGLLLRSREVAVAVALGVALVVVVARFVGVGGRRPASSSARPGA